MKLEHICCNLCGQDAARRLFSQHDLLVASNIEFSVVKCTNCGLVYVNPRPTVDDIHRFYPDNFFSYQLEVLAPKNASLRRRLVSYVANSSTEQRVKTVQKLVKPNQEFEVLDIGCGKGGFLYALKNQLGCQVSGLDFDENSVNYCKEKLKLSVFQGGALAIEKLGKQYDLVTMWHFLEHEFDPYGALKSINKVLKDDQYLLLEVPNAESAENLLFGKHSFLYDIPRHLYDFSPTTITRLLENAGFKVECIKFPYFSGGWIGTVQSTLCKGRVFSDLENHIYSFFALSLLCLPIDLLCSLTRKGSIMTVLAKKVENSP